MSLKRLRTQPRHSLLQNAWSTLLLSSLIVNSTSSIGCSDNADTYDTLTPPSSLSRADLRHIPPGMLAQRLLEQGHLLKAESRESRWEALRLYEEAIGVAIGRTDYSVAAEAARNASLVLRDSLPGRIPSEDSNSLSDKQKADLDASIQYMYKAIRYNEIAGNKVQELRDTNSLLALLLQRSGPDDRVTMNTLIQRLRESDTRSSELDANIRLQVRMDSAFDLMGQAKFEAASSALEKSIELFSEELDEAKIEAQAQGIDFDDTAFDLNRIALAIYEQAGAELYLGNFGNAVSLSNRAIALGKDTNDERGSHSQGQLRRAELRRVYAMAMDWGNYLTKSEGVQNGAVKAPEFQLSEMQTALDELGVGGGQGHANSVLTQYQWRLDYCAAIIDVASSIESAEGPRVSLKMQALESHLDSIVDSRHFKPIDLKFEVISATLSLMVYLLDNGTLEPSVAKKYSGIVAEYSEYLLTLDRRVGHTCEVPVVRSFIDHVDGYTRQLEGYSQTSICREFPAGSIY